MSTTQKLPRALERAIEATENFHTKNVATFVGIQEGFGAIPDFELWNLLIPVGIHPEGSTVSRATIEAHGYRLPVRRGYRSLTTEQRAERYFERYLCPEPKEQGMALYRKDRLNGTNIMCAPPISTLAMLYNTLAHGDTILSEAERLGLTIYEMQAYVADMEEAAAREFALRDEMQAQEDRERQQADEAPTLRILGADPRQDFLPENAPA